MANNIDHEDFPADAAFPAFPALAAIFRHDAARRFIAGLTVALVVVPQSMAYAQLAGMPAYFGLYAAFLPVMVGALWDPRTSSAVGRSRWFRCSRLRA